MTIDKFDELHKKKGGFFVLKNFVEDNKPLDFIAEHFCVSKFAVKLWCRDLFGGYDPRKNRRKMIVNEMVEFAKKNSFKDFKAKYRSPSRHYYYMALAECYAKRIYKRK